jgi:hypothetical protein
MLFMFRISAEQMCPLGVWPLGGLRERAEKYVLVV